MAGDKQPLAGEAAEENLALKIESDKDRYAALKRVVPTAGIGHFAEWFDFALYGTLATVIGLNFFEKGNPQAAMLSTFAVFAAGFLIRPIGGMFWGSLGDRFGRKNVLAAIILCTTACTFLMGCLPTYHSLGIWASVLLVVLRLVQGFAAGGESSGSTTLLLEFAPSKRRGFVTSFIDLFGVASYLAGAGIVLLLSAAVGEAAVEAWAWRIPFFIALPLGWIGFYMREKLEDTPEFQAAQKMGKVQKSPLKMSVKTQWKALLFCAGFVTIKSVGHWMLQTFMPAYLQTDLHYGQLTSYGATFLGFLVCFALIAPFGILSDKIGRKPVMAIGCVGFIVLTYPTLMLMASGTFWAATAAMAVLGICLAAVDGAINAAMAELFPTNLRFGSMALAYNIAVSLFGGLTPYISSWLVTATGNQFAPAFWLMLAGAISLVTVFKAKETAHSPLAS